MASGRQILRTSMADWLMEASVLLAVFPPLDALLKDGSPRLWLVAVAEAMALTALGGGLYLRKLEAEENDQ